MSNEVLDAVERLAPVIDAHRLDGEEHARMAPEVRDAAGSAGLFRLFAPRDVGGAEVSLPTVVEAFSRIGALDPTVGWYMGNSSQACLLSARLRPEHRQELFANPDRTFGFSAAVGGRATRVTGGFHLDGEWPLVTGVLDSDWCALNMVVDDPAAGDTAPADVRLFLVPTALLDVDPIWDRSVAMRATGSHRVTISNGEVPEWCGPPPSQALDVDEPLFRLSPAITAMTSNASIPVGILEAAIQAAGAELADKVSTISGARSTDSTALLEMVADARSAAYSLLAGARAAARDCWDAVANGGYPTREQRAAVFGLVNYSATVAREMTSRLYGRSSRAAFFAGHPLEIALRNIHAVSYGTEVLRPFQYGAARVALGHEPGVPGF